MLTRLSKSLTSRTALTVYLLYLQGGHIFNTWFDYEPRLETGFYCLNTKVGTDLIVRSPIRSGFEVVSARRLVCAFSNTNPTVYIYVRAAGRPERSWNVAFRYHGADPIIVQEAANRIRITVAGPAQILKQLVQLDLLDIVYTLSPQAPGG